jgi:GntR family transcriptional regulator/MocR family aminotransferase
MAVATMREELMTTFGRATVELPVTADRGDGAPLTTQIAAQLREALADGRLAPGERLPSSRALAASLGVSRTVVTAAYTQLFAEGWLEGRHGSGTYVAAGPGSPPAEAVPDPGAPVAVPPAGSAAVFPAAVLLAAGPRDAGPRGAGPRGAGPRGAGPGAAGPSSGPSSSPVNLRPGIPWTDGIDQAAWRRAWRQAGRQPLSPWPDPGGLPALRQALTAYLRRGRGIRCTSSQILPTRGVSAGLRLAAAALLRPGDRVGVEEPGYPAARSVLAAHGARLVPCRVDAAGLVVEDLPTDLRLVYTTPAHQYPLGGRLPVRRRQALVAWARATGALILEDDYDGEFRYDVAPLPTLFGLDPEAVIYLGTTSKTLTPALGAGWLVARPDLIPVLTQAAAGLGERVPEPVQHVVAGLLASGELERHVRRMRHEYARRRAVMTAILGEVPAGQAVPAARLTGDTAGMHMVLELPPGLVDPVVTAAWQRGVTIAALDHRYYAGPVTGHGLVLGYGAADLAGVRRGCRVIAGILGGSRNGSPGPPGGWPPPLDVPPGAGRPGPARPGVAAAGQVAGS